MSDLELGRTAYTVGVEEARERVVAAAAEGRPIVRMGVRTSQDPGACSDGAIVFLTATGAQNFLDRYGPIASAPSIVYEMLLPDGWATDVTPEPDARGVHRLLRDAILVGPAKALV